MAKEINGIDYQDLARTALQGLSLTREQCYAVLRSPEEIPYLFDSCFD